MTRRITSAALSVLAALCFFCLSANPQTTYTMPSPFLCRCGIALSGNAVLPILAPRHTDGGQHGKIVGSFFSQPHPKPQKSRCRGYPGHQIPMRATWLLLFPSHSQRHLETIQARSSSIGGTKTRTACCIAEQHRGHGKIKSSATAGDVPGAPQSC